ncbi:MAG: OmpA family protein [Cyclobacteriaceae bacterium]|nr:OmpA family protein [Cyclobacteriaceae bacterium]
MTRIALFILWLLGFTSMAQTFAPRYELIKIKEVNSAYHDAAPVISPDGKKLYFFVVGHPSNTYGTQGSQDIWTSTRDEKGVWSAPQHLGSPFNQNKANQVFQVLADGTLLVRGGRSKNEVGFSLVSSGGAWTELKIKDFESMAKGRFNGATISQDRKHLVLYFSEIAGAVKSDLYVSHEEGGSWSRPVKLKFSNNTDEFAPFIGPDNKTLYFASDRLGAGRQGGADIYKTTRLDDSWNNWSDVVNLGKPVNTAAADDYFSMDSNGNVYTARSNSRIDGGNLDIFVLVPKDIKVMVAGTVYDEKTNQPIASSVTVTVKDLKPVSLKTPATGKYETRIPETNEYSVSASASGYQPKEIAITVPALGGDTTLVADVYLTPIAKKLMIAGSVFNKKTNDLLSAKVDFTLRPDRKSTYSVAAEGGKFSLEVGKLGWYVLTASAEGYLPATDSLNFDSEDASPVSKDLYLAPIEVGLTVRLKNIYFDFNKTTLKPESFVELNKVVDFLQSNPTVEIEIAGHTDSKGTDEYNNTLSQGRSQAVVDYLVSQGIDAVRLTARGYGESKPIDTNDTPEGQANNRRVEFTVLKK